MVSSCSECHGAGHMRGMPPELTTTPGGNPVIITTPCYQCQPISGVPPMVNRPEPTRRTNILLDAEFWKELGLEVRDDRSQ